NRKILEGFHFVTFFDVGISVSFFRYSNPVVVFRNVPTVNGQSIWPATAIGIKLKVFVGVTHFNHLVVVELIFSDRDHVLSSGVEPAIYSYSSFFWIAISKEQQGFVIVFPIQDLTFLIFTFCDGDIIPINGIEPTIHRYHFLIIGLSIGGKTCGERSSKKGKNH